MMKLKPHSEAVDRGIFVQPRCFASVVPGKTWAGALITDEDPLDQLSRATRHPTRLGTTIYAHRRPRGMR
jgi:hypothetical protein